MSFSFSAPLYRDRKRRKGQALRAAAPALTPLSIPDVLAANRETTELKVTVGRTTLVGIRPVQPLANITIAAPKMGRVPNKKGSPTFLHERIRYLVNPVFAVLNRHV